MDDRTQTLLDDSYLRPGIVSRAGAIGLAAVGVGAGVLLACYGASFFFNTNNNRLNVLTAKIEELLQKPNRSDETVAKLDDLKRDTNKIGGNIATTLASIEDSLEELKHRPIADSKITARLSSIEEGIEELQHRQIIAGDPDRHVKTVAGNVINRQVTVFYNVPHDNGAVYTGWVYPDGASADQQPASQYCYWISNEFNGTSTRIDIANNRVQLPNVGAVPDLEEALTKCTWWRGSVN